MAKVELLAPAGSKESFYSAINAGCNAVYLGGMKFGARSYANNFSLEELSEMLEYARLFDVKVYCTVNTVIFEDELEEVLDFIGEIHKLGIDGVLIQDYGLLNIVHKIYPNLILHASTQMNVTTLEEVKVLKEMGVKRVVLARETPIEVIRKIKETLDIEIEVFVHGAICISYSGNCYMSSVITKRSGNRGKCAGSCRLEYKLCSDNGYDEKFNYPISSKDLMGLHNLNELLDAKVDSLKIEGRMKRNEYVGQVVSSYRKAIDSYYDKNIIIDKALEEKKLKLIFNRGFTKGFLFKEKNSLIINSDQPNHIGIVVGKVTKTYPNNTVDIKLIDNISFGDSLRLVGKATDAITINQVKSGNTLKKQAQKDEVVNVKVHSSNGLLNALVYKTTDKAQLDEIAKMTPPVINIKAKTYLINNDLYLEVTDGKYIITKKVEIDELSNNNYNERIISQFKKCGPLYKMVNIENSLDKEVFVQVSKLNNLRREVLDELTKKRSENKEQYQKEAYDFPKITQTRDALHLSCRVRTLEQLNACLALGIKNIYIADFNVYKNYCDSKDDVKVLYYPPRVGNIHKTNNIVTSNISCYNKENFTSVYANCCNSYTLRSLASKVKQIGLSIELDKTRMKMMLDNYKLKYGSLPNLEVLVYGRYELMIMKYCVINDKVLKSTDKLKDKLFCNECLKHNYTLVDKKGYSFPLIREENCNLRVLNSKITNLIDNLDELIDLGINSLLLDFILETPNEVKMIINSFNNKLNDLTLKQNKNPLYTSGHYNEGVL